MTCRISIGEKKHERKNLSLFTTPNAGSLYLEQRGRISSKWGVSENNRRAKYYSITRAGRKQLAAEEEEWQRTSAIMTRLLAPSKENA